MEGEICGPCLQRLLNLKTVAITEICVTGQAGHGQVKNLLETPDPKRKLLTQFPTIAI